MAGFSPGAGPAIVRAARPATDCRDQMRVQARSPGGWGAGMIVSFDLGLGEQMTTTAAHVQQRSETDPISLNGRDT